MTFHKRLLGAAAALALAAAPLAAAAQSVGGVGSTQSVSASVTVKSIDLATRHVTVATPSGETFTLKVGPAVQNLDKVKPGDTIKATYERSTVFVLSKPNTALPADTETTIAARAAKGEVPAAVVANHLVVTGAVIGIDQENHTLELVDPQGGQVLKVNVKPANYADLANVKLGDTITAYVTESLLIAVQ